MTASGSNAACIQLLNKGMYIEDCAMLLAKSTYSNIQCVQKLYNLCVHVCLQVFVAATDAYHKLFNLINYNTRLILIET